MSMNDVSGTTASPRFCAARSKQIYRGTVGRMGRLVPPVEAVFAMERPDCYWLRT